MKGRNGRRAGILGGVLTALILLLFLGAAWWQGVLPFIGAR